VDCVVHDAVFSDKVFGAGVYYVCCDHVWWQLRVQSVLIRTVLLQELRASATPPQFA
jgi:hypothetical protein